LAVSGQPLHNLNCAKLIPAGELQGVRSCSCGAERPRSLDDVSGEEWNAASAAYRNKIASPKFPGYSMLDEHHGQDHDEAGTIPPVDSGDLAATLTRWWVQKAEEEARELVPKAVEYGGAHRASDLVQLGRTIAELTGFDADTRRLRGLDTDAFYQELACYFYLQGKMGRWQAALLEGRQVSDDTVHDIKIYTTMVQRIREQGGWPV
jgi:hypothetical protein